MTRLHVIAIILLAFLAACSSTAASLPPRPVASDAIGTDIDVWTSGGEGAVYREGDAIDIYFRANSDCFVTVYDISTDGAVRILFPQYPDDGFVYGGVTYRLPEYYGAGPFRVTGPRGIEYLHAVATLEPSAFRYAVRSHGYMLDVDPVSGDPYIAINSINERIISRHHIRATATTSFFVGGLVWYPRYTCRGCHAGPARFDPYADVCTRYSMIVAHDYDYWWTHDYHPARVHFAFSGPFWRFELRTGPFRPHRHRYTDCAWGFGNYRPRVVPKHSYVVIERTSPRVEAHRSYEREYRPITYTERSRDVGRERSATRSDESSRTRTSAPASTTTRERSATMPDESSRTRTSAPASTTTRERSATMPDESSRTRTSAPASTTTRERSATMPDESSRTGQRPGITRASADDARRIEGSKSARRKRSDRA
ncbi:MAG: DUF4384 domain-containing protein [Ignavibacteria bacterium]|nr:DUF4384 domain-containing protein [Ignavibacteria bacterium]